MREGLRRVSVLDSLAVLRAYVQNLQLDAPIPSKIEVFSQFKGNKIDRRAMVSEWELELLGREVVIHSATLGRAPETFRRWRCFADSVNNLKKIEEGASELLEPTEILLEFFRMAHRQFPWQSSINWSMLCRYKRLYNSPKLDNLLKQQTGFSSGELYRTFFVVFSLSLERLVNVVPINTDGIGVTCEQIRAFLDRFSCSFHALKTLLLNEQRLDSTYAYAFSGFRRVGITDFMRRKVCDDEKRQWKFDTFMRDSFGAELDLTTFLFQGDLDDLLPQSVRDRRRQESTSSGSGRP